MNKTKFYIGCSSYSTLSWKKIFYPDELPKKDWFTYYCTYFNTYEFNGSFYRFPTVSGLKKWYDKTPEDFTFSIKIPKSITHIKKLIACEKEISDFYSVISEGLSDKLACVLWQFPPSFVFNEKNLEGVVSVLNDQFKNVVEFRHNSWWNIDVLNRLFTKNAIFCNPSYPGLPHKAIKNNKCGYFREHGVPKLFYSEYSLSEIENLYEQILINNYDEVYVYFNNTASTAGIINALQFNNLLEK